MTEARRLRLGILVALTASGALPALGSAGCGEVTVGQSGSTSSSSGTTTTGATTTGTGGAGGSATTTGTGGGGNPPVCSNGNPTQQCFTLDQLEDQINNPPMGGDASDAGTDGGVMLTECPAPEIVQDGCCIPATSGPFEKGSECCYWFCPSGCCGRAFVVGDHGRIARAVRRDDWLTENAPIDEGKPGEATRHALHEAWLRDAQMEHASIASFARFTLELLGLGAPPELIADSQRASLDEIEHARLCFALAARFGGAPVGPGALDVTGSARAVELAESVAAAVREGVIGETIAALVAKEQLAAATDPSVRAALLRIAADEESHAALAFRFVRWGIEAGGAPVREAARRALDEGMRAARSAPIEAVTGVEAGAWGRFGRLDAAEMRAVTAAALDEVIAPCAEMVLGAA